MRPLAPARTLLCRLPLLLLLSWAAAPGPSSALQLFEEDAQPLSALLDGEDIVVGDKRFDDFSYSFNGDMPEPSLVNVIPFVGDDGKIGVRFQAPFIDLFSNGVGSDALLGFRVSVLDPSRFIVGADLDGNPELLGDPPETGSMSVVETLDLPPFGSSNLHLSIFDSESSGQRLFDWEDFEPVQTLRVSKNILAVATQTHIPTLSRIDQTFEQVQVPEPGVLTSLGTGLFGLVFLGRARWSRMA